MEDKTAKVDALKALISFMRKKQFEGEGDTPIEVEVSTETENPKEETKENNVEDDIIQKFIESEKAKQNKKDDSPKAIVFQKKQQIIAPVNKKQKK